MAWLQKATTIDAGVQTDFEPLYSDRQLNAELHTHALSRDPSSDVALRAHAELPQLSSAPANMSALLATTVSPPCVSRNESRSVSRNESRKESRNESRNESNGVICPEASPLNTCYPPVALSTFKGRVATAAATAATADANTPGFDPTRSITVGSSCDVYTTGKPSHFDVEDCGLVMPNY